MNNIEQQNFDYSFLDSETRAFIQEKVQAIHMRLKRTAEDVIAIGQDLLEVKARLRHGQFGQWIQAEFSMSERHAQNFMNVALRFGSKSAIIALLPITVIYELASPSTPDRIIELVEEGMIEPTVPNIREVRQEIHLRELAERPAPTPLFVHSEPPAPIEAIQPLQEVVPHILPPQVTRQSSVPTALLMSESNEWYTPKPYVDAARELMRGIDVDPASNEFANRIVQATTYYDILSNGLDKPWAGHVWLNPPYGRDAVSNQELWSRRLIEQFDAGITTEAILLVNAVTDRKWFQPLWQFPICFTDHRIRFYNTEIEGGQPTHGNALVYLGNQQERFMDIFEPFGVIAIAQRRTQR